MKWNIDDLLSAVKGSLICKKQESFQSVHCDTRNITQRGACFFALKGQRDGHLYLQEAFKKKASVLVVEDAVTAESLKNQITAVQVSNTSKALLDFAKFWKNKQGFQTVAVTGSVGKTSAKHFCSILLKDRVQVSPKSYNNELGVSLSVLQMDHHPKTLVQEVGTSQPGEINALCRVLEPKTAVCTEVAWSHVEGLGDIRKIAKEKEDVYRLAEIGLFNMDNEWTKKMYENFRGSKTITFSRVDPKCDIYLSVQKVSPGFIDVTGHILGEAGQARVHVAGKHYLTSIMAAAAVAVSLDQSSKEIWRGLPLLSVSDRGAQWIKISGGIKIFLDSYNASPCSMDAFLEYLSICGKECVLLVGDMLELGYKSSFFHQELGRKAGLISCEHMFFIGDFRADFENGLKKSPFKGRCYLFEEYSQDCCKKIMSVLNENNFLAVKASRGLRLERVVEGLKCEVFS